MDEGRLPWDPPGLFLRLVYTTEASRVDPDPITAPPAAAPELAPLTLEVATADAIWRELAGITSW